VPAVAMPFVALLAMQLRWNVFTVGATPQL
jgi:hypothetical protein